MDTNSHECIDLSDRPLFWIDRVVRYARLMGLATQVLESPENARLWLSMPKKGLGGAIPLEYAETEFGAREVEDLLGRIEYGVYS